MAYDKNHPFRARLSQRRRLSGNGSQKDIYQLEIDLTGGDIAYEPGDWLAVLPENPPDQIQRMAQLLGLTVDETVQLPRWTEPMTVGDALQKHLTISRPHRSLLTWLQEQTGGRNARLETLPTQADGEDPTAGLSVADLLDRFGLAVDHVSSFLAQLKPLMPRLYSIASSQKRYPQSLQLVVATAHFQDRNGHRRDGLASGFLNHRLAIGDELRVFPVKTRMRMPTDGSDLIMVGPGVGIAPFLGFLQDRDSRDGTQAVGRCWLFFGDRHCESDFICEEELMDYRRRGLLDRLSLAFSRDQSEKIYVQHRLLEERDEVWRWLNNGAHFYVCGDGQMGRDVEAALLTVLERCAGFSGDRARDFLQDLKKSRRYQQDVY